MASFVIKGLKVGAVCHCEIIYFSLSKLEWKINYSNLDVTVFLDVCSQWRIQDLKAGGADTRPKNFAN